jgi:hypothetical protein
VSSRSLKIYDLLEKHELKVVDALESMAIGRCSRIEVKEHLKTCLHFSGCTIPTPEEFEFMVTFVIDNYKRFCLKELGCAFEMYALNKLDVDKAIKFTPKFVGEVLSAYEKISVKVRKSIVVQEPEPPVIEISDDEILDYVTEYWKTSVKKNFILLNEKAFDILWKRKILNSSIVTKEKADAIRNKVIAIVITSQSNSAKESLSSETFVRTLCKKYTLSLYLDNQL